MCMLTLMERYMQKRRKCKPIVRHIGSEVWSKGLPTVAGCGCLVPLPSCCFGLMPWLSELAPTATHRAVTGMR